MIEPSSSLSYHASLKNRMSMSLSTTVSLITTVLLRTDLAFREAHLSHCLVQFFGNRYRNQVITIALPDLVLGDTVTTFRVMGDVFIAYKSESYRLISLLCVSCKMMEQIIASNMLKHLENSAILADSQY